jgi:lysocardiolipin and lysophospholipid acyltransferase
MRVSVGGLFFVLLLATVTYNGCLLLVSPLLLLLPISLSVYRRWIDYFLALWYHFPAALIELVYRVRVRVCGDLQKVQGPCLIVLNHRTRFDWLFFWSYIVRMGTPHKHKIVLKDILKRVPGFGWAMQACQFIFLTRDWTKDKKVLSDNLGYITSRGYPIQLLFFPEGTDLSDSNRLKGHVFAKKNGLQPYDYVLHPRTKGFMHCLQELRKGTTPPNILNVTVGYVGTIPQNESDILAGLWPSEVHFCAETIPPSEIPSTEDEISDWLKQSWQEKEQVLKRFYQDKKFCSPYLEEGSFSCIRCTLFSALVFWLALLVASFYIFFTYKWVLLLLSLGYFAFANLGPGFDWLVLRLHQMTYQAKLFK